MDNLRKALTEVMGIQLKPRKARQYFFNVYSYMLYQNTPALLETLDYRNSLPLEVKSREKYFIFRFILKLLKDKHPKKLAALSPVNS